MEAMSQVMKLRIEIGLNWLGWKTFDWNLSIVGHLNLFIKETVITYIGNYFSGSSHEIKNKIVHFLD